ncbi:hypothetical protein [Nocardia macrotermitis]|uniref:Uncharacterized protein n=1 Tax=Nocardia macrotermitis TaxID=2585198 RepID=A0A7K0D6Y6_9NOCA|nr:hypothetical protein [Nocardia macrotermitis]MQY21419.1 hypothetical protein [Nocardia macrotermitis]
MSNGGAGRVFGVLGGLVVGVLVTSVAAVALFMDRVHTLRTYPAPTPSVYAASVKEVRSPMDSGRDEVWLGRLDGGEVVRGHVVPIPLGWGIEPRIEWRTDVVVLRFEPGGEIRVPMTMVIDRR